VEIFSIEEEFGKGVGGSDFIVSELREVICIGMEDSNARVGGGGEIG
jgi:hypothetical protein